MIQRLQTAKNGDIEPTRAGSPPQFHCCAFAVFVQDCSCQECERLEHPSRQIGIVFPLLRLAAPVQDDILSQVWSAYKRSARKPESMQLLLTGILPRRMTLRRV